VPPHEEVFVNQRWLISAIVGVALIALPFVYRNPYHLHILILILIWSFAYTSWSVMGRFGLVSLGHGGFIAAFVFAEIISLGGLFSDLEWGYVLAFAFFIVMMFIRPAGLFARRS